MAVYTHTGSINSNYTLKLTVTETDVVTAVNTSKVNWTAQLVSSGGGDFSLIGATVTVTINGVEVYDVYAQRSITAGGTLTIASGTTAAIAHNSDGSKSVSCSLKWDQSSTASYTPGDCTASGTLALTTIPRYAVINYFRNSTVNANLIDRVYLEIDTDVTCNQLQCQVNGGSWVTYISNSFESSEWSITGLSPNTTYSIKARVRNAVSGLYTESSTISSTTKNYATITSAPDLSFGNTLAIGYSNPSSATMNIALYNNGSTAPYAEYRTCTGSSYTFTFTQAELDLIYADMTNNSPISAKVYLRTTQGGVNYYSSDTITITQIGNAYTSYLNVSNVWKRGKVWINVSGTWRRGLKWINVSGTWKRGK